MQTRTIAPASKTAKQFDGWSFGIGRATSIADLNKTVYNSTSKMLSNGAISGLSGMAAVAIGYNGIALAHTVNDRAFLFALAAMCIGAAAETFKETKKYALLRRETIAKLDLARKS